MTSSQRRIAFVTGTRAEFGLLIPVLKALRGRAGIAVRLYATGTHPVSAYGRTIDEMTASGFPPDRVVDILVGGDSSASMGKTIGLGTISFIDIFETDRPDCIVILGDRFELLAVATAALSLGIPLVHLEGGHITEGAIDDSIRHALTKMARLHMTSTEVYARRLRQMGEDPSTIHVVGATGIDNILDAPRLDLRALEESLNFELSGSPLFLVTHHPVTSATEHSPTEEIKELLDALDEFETATIVFTQPNADPGNREINEAVRAFVIRKASQRLMVPSLGFVRYLSLAEAADAVIGNSSSGVIEVPSLGVPTVNIGPRQKGRLRAPSVIDVEPDSRSISDGVRRALSPEMREVARRRSNPMGDGTAGKQIADILCGTDFARVGAKVFFDLPSA
ncbi:UDP-N-acetylglucosamine 2-epimerase (non-hydrolysing)/GDP/UDP-N,N'-diacetylbacillosamine 2-epimerase (hydrolysing) [Ciceribacter lividus]|uniref:UDP-N-acetylglucosamine 2-epimerase (Non-hydrolysing)/GDP/UDP-N,N'-diacetylbacillosamine 2-epimerase (Hydrolysing) n=1 Tax=Ciceribacter lividus TaxID=1197950 RepID=A0A6I7HI04_9HYPH|nr:UDP-N-acetylglucosamine 2-epimerase [Ciceribacter lividus]RCW21173.1 UDP-N-acetylglucosamine 2-epimerase (non-hydrolysing)/GDP/UDP-N,N'-diacetylbacillosamine 2-epimerase (hydrolysing) [Ciceribacter lividus]